MSERTVAAPVAAPPAPAATPVLELRDVEKRYGDSVAVAGIDLSVDDGEFVGLLGPSGCGKSTTLRMIAGFETPSRGTVMLDGADVSDVPAARRRTNLVFQHYALFPHLDVAENVAFGLRSRGMGRKPARARAEEALAQVALTGYARRATASLSGGEQQRVALARALVNEPRVLLLDEPLGALDLSLRREMQVELKAIQNTAGRTFVHVTHDQEEALALSDRIAVMRNGHIEQFDTPRGLWERPATVFVAEFVGSSNVLRGRAIDGGVEACGLVLPGVGSLAPGTPAALCVRAEQVSVTVAGTPAQTDVRLDGHIHESAFLGARVTTIVTLGDGTRVSADLARTDAAAMAGPGEPVTVGWARDDGRILPVEDAPE